MPILAPEETISITIDNQVGQNLEKTKIRLWQVSEYGDFFFSRTFEYGEITNASSSS
jgi:hypothetical protein